MAQGDSGDFDLIKVLWSKINSATVPQLSPDSPLKACFLMETPGFSIKPDTYDTDGWKSKRVETDPHPDRMVAELADKVPALSPFYYDTGSRISSYWEQLVTTFQIPSQESDTDLQEKYDEAISVLYGDEKTYLEGEMRKEITKKVEKLRADWTEAKEGIKSFWGEKKKEENWPQNFEMDARPKVDQVNDAFTEYDNFRCFIENYQAAIFRYRRGDLSRLLLHQAQAMGQYKYHDPGEGGSAAPFYVTRFEPKDWWEWFKEDYKDNRGWTQVNISRNERSSTSDSTFSKLSTKVSASYQMCSVSVSHSSKKERKTQSISAKDLSISFMVRKVKINRPWLETSIFNYKTVGISGLKAETWSNGTLDSEKNHGQFPLLPTAMVVAKDVSIHFGEENYSSESMSEEQETSVEVGVNIGCFSLGTGVGYGSGSSHSEAKLDKKSNTLVQRGAQVIGWVCVAVPSFPAVSIEN